MTTTLRTLWSIGAAILAFAAAVPSGGGCPPPTRRCPPAAFGGVPGAPSALRDMRAGAEAILRDVAASQWGRADAAVTAVTSDEHDIEMAMTGPAAQARTVTALRQAVFALVDAVGVHSAAQSAQAARRVLACCARLGRPLAGAGASATLGAGIRALPSASR